MEHQIEYIINSIEPSCKKGHVAVELSPRHNIPESEKPSSSNMHIMSNMPKEIENHFKMMMQQTMPHQSCKECDQWNIILVIPEIDFHSFNWGYGDIIKGNFEKIKDAKKINPMEE